jgi:hypothetical protein
MVIFRIAWILATVCIATSGCGGSRLGGGDELCRRFFQYVESSVGGHQSSVVLRGGWGGDTEGVVMTHECKFSGAVAGEEFCAYLADNTSWEFGRFNVQRFAQCFSDPTTVSSLEAAAESSLPSSVSTRITTSNDRAVRVVLQFSPASMESSLYTLSIDLIQQLAESPPI